MSSLYFTICGLFCITLLMLLFFSRKRIESKETKIYGFMIISSFIDIILVIAELLITGLYLNNQTLIIVEILNKIDFIHYIIWPTLMFFYIFYITYENSHKYDIIKNIALIFDVICIAIEFFLPIEIIKQGNTMGVTGLATYFVYFIALIYFLAIIIILLMNIKKVFSKKYAPFIILFFLFIVALIVRAVDPTLVVLPAIIVYINMIMYFTIENPDVKMLEQISLAKDQAEKANAAKTDFLSSMSHEIRTPLNAIVGFSEAIKEEETLEAAKQDAKDIILASQNLLEIVNGILDISKIEANKMEIVNTEYDLVEECKLIAKLIKPRIGEKPIELEVNIAPDIPHTLYGDKSKVKEILSNLLTNAVKYTESGTISFNVSCINKNDECSLVFSVEDTGRGIKPEKIDHLFKKFERLEEDRNTTVEGAGLGLAITKSLVEMMDGKIIVQSVFGSGSKFTVYLKQKIIPEKRYHLNSDFAKEPLDLSGKRILIVDDNELNIKVAERLLKKYNLIIDTCSSGVSCLEKIQDGEIYDLILMDDMMPKMSGTETLHLLKEIPSFKTRVVVLTANAIEGMKEKYLSVGFDDYLSKPMENKEVDRILRKFLNKEYHPSEFAPLPDDFYEISETAILNINNLEEKAKK